MTRLLWDQIGDRRYEAGCDRGVLYLPDNTGVAWNGLTSVEEDTSDITVTQSYLDGVKYLNRRSVGDYSATMKALTYPDEFLPFDGVIEFTPGMFGSNQQVNETFGLSYRTKIGNDVDGIDYGYKLHLLYNLTASPANKAFSSLAATTTPLEFSWKISGIPIYVTGLRPTVHIVLDSTKGESWQMAVFENVLYGTSDTEPTLPTPADLVQMIEDASLDVITDPITEPL